MVTDLTPEQRAEYDKMLAQVQWDLPGMEKFDDRERQHFIRSIQQGDIVTSIHSLGWALWPTTNRGYYDSENLRRIADFLEIQNKPFWDDYERYCDEQQSGATDEADAGDSPAGFDLFDEPPGTTEGLV